MIVPVQGETDRSEFRFAMIRGAAQRTACRLLRDHSWEPIRQLRVWASGWRAGTENPVSNTKPEIFANPDYYRERARQMLELAAQAHTEEAKASLVALAQNWEGFAEWAQHPE